MTSFHDTAMFYATNLQWFVFPLQPHGKRPITAHGVLDSSNDPAQVSAWWNYTPNANIGIDCGKSNLAVIDLDGPEGIEHWNAIQDNIPDFTTPIQYTGGGGAHLLFVQPEGERRVKNSASKIAPKVDTRGDGGYIVVAPSIHPSGEAYRWSESPIETALSAFPSFCLEMLYAASDPKPITTPSIDTKNQNTDRILTRTYDRVALAPKGSRNDTLNRAAFYLGKFVARGQMRESEVREILLAAAARAGLNTREASATISSGLLGAAKGI